MCIKKIINIAFSKKSLAIFNNSIRTGSSTTSILHERPQLERSVNSVQLLGRVGTDPKKVGTGQDTAVTFSLATDINYLHESGGIAQRTEWHNVICVKPALRDTVFNYVKKGHRLFVTGRITYGEIKGDDRATASITADDVIFCQNKTKSS